MSNHGMDPKDSPMAKEFIEANLEHFEKNEKLAKDHLLQNALGATGRFPEGKLTKSDEGELAFAVQADPEKKLIHLNFGKPVAWFSLTPQLANDLANSLLRHARAMGHTAVVNLGKKPTVEDLEKMLKGDGGGIEILPNGEIRST